MSNTRAQLQQRQARRVEPRAVFRAVCDDARGWCSGRNAWIRLPLLIYLAHAGLGYANRSNFWSVFSGINLGIHELGHMVFGPFGALMAAAGGSILQCLAPIVAAAMFSRQRDYFAVAVAVGWLATNLFEVAIYADDARSLALPLVTPGGGEPIHDWNFILGKLGRLDHDHAIAGLFRALGFLTWTACLGGGGWLLWQMITQRRQTPTHSPNASS